MILLLALSCLTFQDEHYVLCLKAIYMNYSLKVYFNDFYCIFRYVPGRRAN